MPAPAPALRLHGSGFDASGNRIGPARIPLVNGRAVHPEYRESVPEGSSEQASNHQPRPASGRYLITGSSAGGSIS
jgi:hypothetical protein